jgi:tryptophanyl-tRNA synthetase
MRVLSGMQPSGTLHIGNYLGALKQWVAAQSADSFYCVVDLHALTLEIEPATLRRQSYELIATYMAAGLDPEICSIFLQSEVPYHAQINWILECVATYGELSRMTQFKEKSSRKTGYRVGLLTYPVLMAGDILLYETAEVPVGDDQRQHLELTRVIAERFNNRYGPTFVVPIGVQPKVAARVMDLQEPTRKMSKSISSPMGSIFVTDTPAEIDKKIKKAVTDTDNDVRFDWDKKPGVSNLLEIYASFTGESPLAVAERYTRYGDLKSDLSAIVIESLTPIRERYYELMSDQVALRAVVARGALQANEVAGAVYRRAANAIGLI